MSVSIAGECSSFSLAGDILTLASSTGSEGGLILMGGEGEERERGGSDGSLSLEVIFIDVGECRARKGTSDMGDGWEMRNRTHFHFYKAKG